MRYETNGDVTRIYDTKENSFIIDTEQLERVLVCNWYVDNKGYVRTASRKYKRILLHRFLLNTEEMVDHINRDKTDNRLCNLRTCTYQENNRNREYKNTKSGAQGVNIVCKNGRTSYRARICVDGKRISLGYFETLEKAKQAREKAVAVMFSNNPPMVGQNK